MEHSKLLHRVGSIELATIVTTFRDLNCPVTRVKITFLNGSRQIFLDLKASGRVWLYDHVGHERVWLPNDLAPNEFQEDYGRAR